jgi:DNA-binding protein VF530
MSNMPGHQEASAEPQTPESPETRRELRAPELAQPDDGTVPNDSTLPNDGNPELVAPIRKVDPMQGMKLEAILHELVGYFGWEEMGYRINIRCFNEDPSIGSSLKFLRKTPWARTKVDNLFLSMRAEQAEQAEPTEQAESTEQAGYTG